MKAGALLFMHGTVSRLRCFAVISKPGFDGACH